MVRRIAVLLFLAFGVAAIGMPCHASAAAPADGLYARALEQRRLGDFAAAESLLREAVSREPKRVDALYLLGMVIAFQGRYDDALEFLDRAAELAPKDLDVRLAQAKVASWAKRFADAEREVDAVLEKHPDHVEAWNLKGRIAYYQEHFEAAKAAFERASALAPDNLESLLGGGDVALAQGDRARAETLFTAAKAVAPDSPDVARRFERLDEMRAAAKDWRLDVTASRSRFTRQSRKKWRAGAARLTGRIDADTTAFGAVEMENRFAHTDTTFRVGANRRITSRVDARIEGAATAAARFRPRWDIGAGGGVRVLNNGNIVGPTTVRLDARHREYEGARVSDLNPALRQEFLNGRLWFTGTWINSFDKDGKRLAGWSARADAQLLDRLRVGFGLGKAPESESGISVETRSTAAGIVVGVTPDLDLRVDFLREDRANSYVRKEVSTGLSLRF